MILFVFQWVQSLFQRVARPMRRAYASRSGRRQAPDGAYCNAIDLEDVDGEDEWLRVVPIGENPNHPDGPHEVTPEHIEQMAANFERFDTDVLIDVDHESIRWDGSTRAAGWGSDVEPRDDGLYMRFPSWTPRGEDLVSNRDYRYLSPVYFLNYEAKDGQRIGAVLDSVALTNRPYFDEGEIDAIGNSTSTDSPSAMTLDRDALIEELDLSDDATDEDIMEAIRQREQAPEPDPEPDPDDGSEEGDEDDLKAKVNSLTQQVQALKDERTTDRAETLVDKAVDDEKITPAERDIYLNAARSDYDGTAKKINNMKPGRAKPGTVSLPDGDDDGNGGNNPIANAAAHIRMQRNA